MLQSRQFARVLDQWPKDEEAINARYLIRAGFLSKTAAGVYTLLPLGQRVLHKINAIIREEMNGVGAEELSMPALIPKRIWEQSGRWEVPVVYKLTGADGEEYGLGWTHEEVIAEIGEKYLVAEKFLPRAVYQIQTKFRKEARAKSGILRGREFLMKDLYSFHATEADMRAYYEVVAEAYKRVFARVGLQALVCEASGGDFTKDYTHEFQVVAESGEDLIYVCEAGCGFCQNKEIAKVGAGEQCPQCSKGKIEEKKAIEVGNIFRLGERFSEKFFMASYGIGPTRVLGTIVEVSHDEQGIVWPEAVAPFQAHLLVLGKEEKTRERAKDLYEKLIVQGHEVLFDDREEPAGVKFVDADMIGCPYRIVISDRVPEGEVEIKKRGRAKSEVVGEEEMIKRVFG